MPTDRERRLDAPRRRADARRAVVSPALRAEGRVVETNLDFSMTDQYPPCEKTNSFPPYPGPRRVRRFAL
jgi:hypothetical protein